MTDAVEHFVISLLRDQHDEMKGMVRDLNAKVGRIETDVADLKERTLSPEDARLFRAVATSARWTWKRRLVVAGLLPGAVTVYLWEQVSRILGSLR